MIPKHAKKVFQGEIFSVWQWEQKLYDDSTAIFESISRVDYAHVIGVLPDKRILLIHDEQPHRSAVITPAGGKLEEGETPEMAARREFMEETGYTIGELVPLHSYQASGKSDFIVHAFVGKGLKKAGEPAPEAGEKIKPLIYTFDEFVALGQNSELRDLRLRIMLLEAQIDEEKKKKLHTIFYE